MSIPFSKEDEELERSYIPPDYSEAAKKSEGDEDDEDDDIEIDDDIEDDEDDPAEEEEILEIREKLSETSSGTAASSKPFNPQPYNNPYSQQNQQQKPMSGWNTGGAPWSGQPSGGSTWQPKPIGSGGWNPGGNNNGGGWRPAGTTTVPSSQMISLDRNKRVVLCDVLDCLICTLEGPQKVGLVPRDIWDVQLRLDVFNSLRRFSYLERIYAMIPKDLITNSASSENWITLLNWIACSLATFVRIPTQAVQILTQSFIAQPKVDMIGSVIKGVDPGSIVYIGTQSGFVGQSSVDIDAATELGVDYIDLQNFLIQYS